MTGLSIQSGSSVSGVGSITTSTYGAAGNSLNAVYYGDPPETAWGYWQHYYYPQVILQSYPVYLQDRAMDKGKQAFELVKALQDKKLMKLEKVSDFIEAMDTILKTL